MEPTPTPTPGAPCDGAPEGLVCAVMGSGERGAGDDGLPALQTHLFLPTALAFDPDGAPVVVDFNNQQLRRLLPDGRLLRVVGSGQHAYATEGAPTLVTALENPIDAAIGPDGTIWVMELHGARVLRFDEDGVVETAVGSATQPGYEGYDGDGGPATEASMSQAAGLALGDDGTLYVADTLNHVVRAVDPDGIIRTLAGDGQPGFVDGAATEARFDQPYSLAFGEGALWVADRLNHAVRRVDPDTGEVTTVAGTGEMGSDGDGGPATEAGLRGPLGLAVGPDGAVWVADTDNHAIRRLDLDDGTLTTVVGALGEPGDAEDGVGMDEARLDWPNDVAFGPDGALWIVDTLNDRVRRVVAPLR